MSFLRPSLSLCNKPSLTMEYAFTILCLLSGTAGISTHLSIFINGDWDRHSITLFYIFVATPALLLSLFSILAYWSLFSWSIVGFTSYYSGLFSSIIIYRYFFHPLQSFPGPRLARISTFWSIPSAVIQAQWHLRVQKLHGKYGDIVRIRPREISINNVSAIKGIYGVATKCTKGSFYDLNYPHRSLQMTRNKSYHSKRRRVWDRAFSSQALAGYEPRLLEHCQTFIETISISEGKTLEVTSLIGEFSWDSMGILAVGKPSIFGPGHVQEAEEMKSLARLACLLVWSPWPIILLRNLPVMRNATVRWIEWCKRTVEERKKEDLSYDLFSYLIQDSDSSLGHPEKATHQDLVFDTELAVFAGSDTIASTLNAILFFLAKDPEIFNQLRREVDAAVPFGCTLSHEALAGNPYLEGCINEGLRICPAVMSGVPRETGPEGATIAGVYIPPFTIVSVPTYTMQMDPRNFPEPDKFIPERWSSKPEMIIQKEAFNPFSSGPYACAGRPFAMMEMRLLLATVVRNFDLDFPPGREKQSFETLGGTGPLDCFTTQIPCYHLVFKRRRKAA